MRINTCSPQLLIHLLHPDRMNTEYRIQNTEYRIQMSAQTYVIHSGCLSLSQLAQNTEYRIQNTEYRIQNTEYRTQMSPPEMGAFAGCERCEYSVCEYRSQTEYKPLL